MDEWGPKILIWGMKSQRICFTYKMITFNQFQAQRCQHFYCGQFCWHSKILFEQCNSKIWKEYVNFILEISNSFYISKFWLKINKTTADFSLNTGGGILGAKTESHHKYGILGISGFTNYHSQLIFVNNFCCYLACAENERRIKI